MTATVAREVLNIPMEEIYSDDSFNCRGRIFPGDVIDLARSIQNSGLQSPIIVQRYNKVDNPKIKYRIISGHRRHAAHIINEAKTIEAIVKEIADELTARKLNLEENLKRADLNIVQEANAIQHFRRANWTEEMIAREIGMSRGWVQVRMMLLSLPEDIQVQAAAGFLTQENIRQIYSIKDPDQRYEAVRKIKDAKLAGEKPVKVSRPKTTSDYLAKKPKSKDEVLNFVEMIIDTVGGSFATRCLAWSQGEVTDVEIYRDFKDYCDERGVHYEIPAEIVRAMQL